MTADLSSFSRRIKDPRLQLARPSSGGDEASRFSDNTESDVGFANADEPVHSSWKIANYHNNNNNVPPDTVSDPRSQQQQAAAVEAPLPQAPSLPSRPVSRSFAVFAQDDLALGSMTANGASMGNFVDNSSNVNMTNMARQPPSPAAQHAVPQVNGGGPVGNNMMAGLPMNAGHQMDLNNLYEMVIEFSDVLKHNREMTRGIVASAEEIMVRFVPSLQSANEPLLIASFSDVPLPKVPVPISSRLEARFLVSLPPFCRHPLPMTILTGQYSCPHCRARACLGQRTTHRGNTKARASREHKTDRRF